MLRASVSNLDLYRTWRESEELDLDWIIQIIKGPFEQTPAMRAGEALHKALEEQADGEIGILRHGKYSFDFNFCADCEIEQVSLAGRELRVSQEYGDLLVRGRVDAVIGKTVIDYKSTSQFDADRLMFGYQWRFYLDMMQADRFRWEVFVMKETDDPFDYVISDVHRLEQARYPDLHEDCMKLAADYAGFAKQHLEPSAESSLYITDKDAVGA